MDPITEMKEYIAREGRIDEEAESMLKSAHTSLNEIEERLTRLGEQNRQLIIESAMFKGEIHELRDEEMKSIRDFDEDRKEMKKLKAENEKLRVDYETYRNLWIQREQQIISFTGQLKTEREERWKLEVALCGDEPIEDVSKEFDIIIKRLNKIKARTENSVSRKEYQFR